jgi:hypothetical protein
VNAISNTDKPQDRIYLLRNEPKNHQVMLDTLKKYGIVSEDSQIKDYEFLFSFGKNKKSNNNDDDTDDIGREK